MFGISFRGAGYSPLSILELYMFPILLCHCGEQIALPYRTLQDTKTVEPYWPTENEVLTLVCSRCDKSSFHRVTEILWVNVVPPSQESGTRTFWRVTLRCDDPDCESFVVTHIQTFGGQSPGQLGSKVANAIPSPHCDNGHAAKFGEYPELIEEITPPDVKAYLN